MTSAIFRLCRVVRPVGRSSSNLTHRKMSTASLSKPSSSKGTLSYALLGTTLVASAYTLGALYPIDLFTVISPRVAPPPPPPDHPDALALVERLEREIHELPLLRKLQAMPDSADWYKSRPYASLREERRVNNLTAGALRGAGRLAIPPVCWAKKDESEAYIFVHVGRGLCGHDGIIHGGLIATLLDETLARTVCRRQVLFLNSRLTASRQSSICLRRLASRPI